MPRRKAEPTEITIEYLLPDYIVVRRDQELYGDSDLHIAKVVVDDEAELESGRAFSPDGRALNRDDPKAVAAMELIEGDKSAEWPGWDFGW